LKFCEDSLSRFEERRNLGLTKQQSHRATNLFNCMDGTGDNSGTIETEELIENLGSVRGPLADMLFELLRAEEGHISLSAWVEFIAQIKQQHGSDALDGLLEMMSKIANAILTPDQHARARYCSAQSMKMTRVLWILQKSSPH